jgi:hypothetical protein
VTLECLALRDDRLVELIGQEALIGTTLEELSARLEWQAVREPERSGVMRDRLTMRAGRRSARSGQRRPSQHCLDVSGAIRVMSKPREILFGCDERTERLAMQRNPAAGWCGLLDRQPRQLVPKADLGSRAGQHA